MCIVKWLVYDWLVSMHIVGVFLMDNYEIGWFYKYWSVDVVLGDDV